MHTIYILLSLILSILSIFYGSALYSIFLACISCSHFAFESIAGMVHADDPESAVLVGVIRRKTQFTPVCELAKTSDFT